MRGLPRAKGGGEGNSPAAPLTRSQKGFTGGAVLGIDQRLIAARNAFFRSSAGAAAVANRPVSEESVMICFSPRLLCLFQVCAPSYSQFVSFFAAHHHSGLGRLHFLRTVLHVARCEELLCTRRTLQNHQSACQARATLCSSFSFSIAKVLRGPEKEKICSI